MIKVLHIVHALTRGGGLSNFVMNYYRSIDRNKVQFDFIYFRESDCDFKEEISSLGGKYYRWREPSISPGFLIDANSFFKTHSNEYIAIHCHALFAVFCYAGIARMHGIKTIIAHSHSSSYSQNGFIRSFRNHIFVYACRYLSDIKLSCSMQSAMFMFGKKNVNKGNVILIPNAIYIERNLYSRENRILIRNEFNISEDEFVIGHVGGFARQKNHAFLLTLFRKILSVKQNAKLVLVGGDGIASGSSLSTIKKMSKELDLENKIVFTGIRSDVSTILNSFDVFVFPSLFEGFGLALVEAQANGLICCASERVPRDTKCTDRAYFLPLDDENAWVDLIASVGHYDRRVNIECFNKYNIRYNAAVLQKIYTDL